VAFNADGTMSKRLHAGKAAHSGVLAAELAASGYTGPTQIYEFEEAACSSLLRHVGSGAAHPCAGALITSTTRHQAILCCGSTHAYVTRRSSSAAGSHAVGCVASGAVGTSKVVDVQCGFDYSPTRRSMPDDLRYIVAAALLDGQALPPQFSDDRIRNREVVELARRLELVKDPDLDTLSRAFRRLGRRAA